jgi:Thioredoxin domain
VKTSNGRCAFNADITQISLGKFKVGIKGLKEAIEEVRALGGQAEGEVAQALLDKLKSQNYIPAAGEADYKKAFLREFKKALGEKVEAEAGGLIIRFLSPICPCSEDFLEVIVTVLSELGLPADVQHVTDAEAIAAFGVSGTPALIINGEVRALGRMPPQKVLKGWLRAIN